MSNVITAVYTNGVFRPLEPVVLPEGAPVQVHVPEEGIHLTRALGSTGCL